MRSLSLAPRVALLVLTYSLSVDAFFRMPLRALVGLARLDPLTDPGKPSPHVHAIYGGNGKLTPFHPLF